MAAEPMDKLWEELGVAKEAEEEKSNVARQRTPAAHNRRAWDCGVPNHGCAGAAFTSACLVKRSELAIQGVYEGIMVGNSSPDKRKQPLTAVPGCVDGPKGPATATENPDSNPYEVSSKDMKITIQSLGAECAYYMAYVTGPTAYVETMKECDTSRTEKRVVEWGQLRNGHWYDVQVFKARDASQLHYNAQYDVPAYYVRFARRIRERFPGHPDSESCNGPHIYYRYMQGTGTLVYYGQEDHQCNWVYAYNNFPEYRVSNCDCRRACVCINEEEDQHQHDVRQRVCCIGTPSDDPPIVRKAAPEYDCCDPVVTSCSVCHTKRRSVYNEMPEERTRGDSKPLDLKWEKFVDQQ